MIGKGQFLLFLQKSGGSNGVAHSLVKVVHASGLESGKLWKAYEEN